MGGLNNIVWVNDWIENIPRLGLGKFDLIICSGVLHHTKDPNISLKILKDSLKDGGGMEVMVYAKYGRTGVYQGQDLLKMVNHGEEDMEMEVDNARAIIEVLPATNWFKKSEQHIPDHRTFGNAGIYDVFLHKRDVSFSVAQLKDWLGEAGLHFVDFSYFLDRDALRLENYVEDEELVGRMDEKEEIAELVHGDIMKHDCFVSNREDAEASFDDWENVAYFHGRPQFFEKSF